MFPDSLDRVHTTPEKFIFTITLIVHTNPSRKRSPSNRMNLKTPAFRFLWMENVLKTELFDNFVVTINPLTCPSFNQTQIRSNLDSLRRRANARNVSFRISLRWPIHIINPVDKTKLSCTTPTDAAPQFL